MRKVAALGASGVVGVGFERTKVPEGSMVITAVGAAARVE